MSNHLAIATVTATLRRTLQATVGADVDGAEATSLRPDASNARSLPDPGVNIYLFQVTPNVAWRNADLPTRNVAGRLVQRPRIALDLHYLFTFYGDESELEPQRVLGSVVRTLHARPLLTRASIENTIADPSFNPFLEGSNLAEEVESVKFTPIPFSLEELSKLWSVLLQTPYALSVAYMGTVVLIEAEEPPRRTLPVRVRNITVFPFQHAFVEAVVAEAAPSAPVIAGEAVLLQGRGLAGSVGAVRFDEALLPPDTVSPTEIRVALTGADLRAGVQGVQVIYENSATSNVAPVVLRPRITQNGGGVYQMAVVDVDGTPFLRATLSPTVGPRQRTVLYLNGLDPTPGTDTAYSVPAEARTADTDTIDFDLTDVASGTYLVRVEVGGAESILDFDDATGVYNEPTVAIP